MTTLIEEQSASEESYYSKVVKRHLELANKPAPVYPVTGKYTQGECKPQLRCANGLTFTIEDSGLRFIWKNATSKRVLIYADTFTGMKYRVSVKAWETDNGARIRTVLYINDVFKGSNSYLKYRSDNALFNMVSSTEKALLYNLNHAESIVIRMAEQDNAQFEAEYKAWNEKLAAGVS